MKSAIGKRLLCSFLGLALIVAISGLMGFFMIKKVTQSGDIVVEEKVPVKSALMKVVIAVERSLNACRSYLVLDKDLDSIEKEINKNLGYFNMYISMLNHGTESYEFKKSPAGKMYSKERIKLKVPGATKEMKFLVGKISQHQKIFTQKAKELIETHKQKVQYSFTYRGIHYDLPAFLYAADIKHRRWFQQLQDSVEYEVEFTGETDLDKCYLYDWFTSYQAEDKELTELLDKFQAVHAKLHHTITDVITTEKGLKKSLLMRGTRYTTKVEQALDKLEKYAEAKIEKINAQEQVCVTTMFETSEIMGNFLGQLDIIANTEMILAQEKVKQGQHFSIWMLSLLIPCAVFLALILGFLVTRSIAKPLTEGSNSLVSSINQISTTATQLSSSFSEATSSTSEISTTVEEVKQTSRLSYEKAEHVTKMAEKALEVSKEGKKSTDDTISGMSRIKEEMEYIAGSIIKLSEQIESIGEIISVVNDLADQSNLLSVNAAIEASKAGDYGKGFAVVAQEVKVLAEQSKEATHQVKNILGDIQKATSAAVMATERGSKAVERGLSLSMLSGEAIRILAESVSESTQASIQISLSSKEQLVGMDQLALGMENIKVASIQNMDSAKQLESATKGMKDLGQKLNDLIGT